ncbi:SDR family NAD(P)-dependent oxidoreductase [Legionella sp. MW5194]|uniref:SDR family NAD(P)-dependent oxidoreductase n=1 Tax=Legionella sp. MW5194 TaxID=2662448 RepID=UPI00193D9A51|nr:SDR family NAD(P)-dependent oxidoreductase [Legionella sp. MW5194]QRN04392.1 SDR family NAD(P)-dependent oxidoreductase [Legionella sp. MW5194]
MFVITGASSGIGRALAWELASRGKSVLAIGRREQQLSETAQFSSLIIGCTADVSTREGRGRIVAALNQVPLIEGLVHNAGIIDPIMPMSVIDEAAWEQTMATNLNAPLFLSQALLHKLQGGRVLHIGSGVAYFPVSGWAAYCVSKAGLSMLTRCWQLECEKTAFASVMPGIIDTDMQRLIRESQFMESDKVAFFKNLHQQNRLVSVETAAAFLAWLLLEVNPRTYASQEWDIYDKSHHPSWLFAPHHVPEWE